MKKISKILLSLMLCLVSCAILSACDITAPPTTLTEAEAESTLETALATTQSSAKMEINTNMGIMGNIKTIITPDITYLETTMFGDIKTWTIDEAGILYDYTISSVTFNDETILSYTKSISEETDIDSMDMTLSDTATFVSGKIENKTTTIVYSDVEEGETVITTYTIKDGVITNMQLADNDGVVYSVITITYGDTVVAPELPTHDGDGNAIVWEEDSNDF